jgi:hypothetical protein
MSDSARSPSEGRRTIREDSSLAVRAACPSASSSSIPPPPPVHHHHHAATAVAAAPACIGASALRAVLEKANLQGVDPDCIKEVVETFGSDLRGKAISDSEWDTKLASLAVFKLELKCAARPTMHLGSELLLLQADDLYKALADRPLPLETALKDSKRWFCGVELYATSVAEAALNARHVWTNVYIKTHTSSDDVKHYAAGAWAKLQEVLQDIAGDYLVLLSGESGSGKTVAAICVGSQMNTKPLTIYFLGMELDLVFDRKTDVDGRTGKIRTAVLVQKLMAAMQHFLGTREVRPSTRDVVVVFDECGSQNSFVRSMCAHRLAVCQAIKERLKTRGKISIVIAGTGVESTTCLPSSMPDSFCLVRMEPRVTWDFMCQQDQSAVRPYGHLLQLRAGDSTVGLAAMLLENSRCAAIFAMYVAQLTITKHLDTTQKPSEEWMDVAVQSLATLLTVVVAEYKRLNGLKAVPFDLCHKYFLRAAWLHMSRYKRDLLPGDHGLITTGGLMTDAAELKTSSELQDAPGKYEVLRRASESEKFSVVVKTGQPRYVVSAAVAAMGLLRFGAPGVVRPPSGDGFELCLLDYAALVASFAKPLSAPTVSDGTADTETMPWRGAEALHREFACSCAGGKMHKIFLHARLDGSAASIRRMNSDSSIRDETGLPKTDEGDVTVWVNAPQASFADMGICCKDRVVLVQAKRYVTTVLTSQQVLEELDKMATPAPREHLCKKVASGDPSDVKVVYVIVVFGAKPADVSAEEASKKVRQEPSEKKSTAWKRWRKDHVADENHAKSKEPTNQKSDEWVKWINRTPLLEKKWAARDVVLVHIPAEAASTALSPIHLSCSDLGEPRVLEQTWDRLRDFDEQVAAADGNERTDPLGTNDGTHVVPVRQAHAPPRRTTHVKTQRQPSIADSFGRRKVSRRRKDDQVEHVQD